MIIIQVTIKVIIVFFCQKKSCWILILPLHLHLLQRCDFYGGKVYLPIFICDTKFLCFIIFRFFQSNSYFAISLWPHFC